jgi:hypothetical protein
MRIQVRCTCAGEPWLRMSASTPRDFGSALVCAQCGRESSLHPESITSNGGLTACLACAHPELFTRKSCPPSLGLGVVVVAAVLAPWTYYLSLVGAAVVDFALYRLVPDVVACYVCGAEHRAFDATPHHPRFDRQIEERLRYGPRAVMGRAMRSGGTAGAPEPEH